MTIDITGTETALDDLIAAANKLKADLHSADLFTVRNALAGVYGLQTYVTAAATAANGAIIFP